MAKWMDNFFNNDLNYTVGADNTNTVPKVNVVEFSDRFELELSAPGYQKDAFSVKLDNNRLTISGKVEKETNEEGKVRRREFFSSSFERSFILPKTIDANSIDATYNNGILRVALPLKEEAKELPPREIAIG
jgi:HSP20 family protein